MDEHLWPSNVPGPCGDPHSWCPETHSQWAKASHVYLSALFMLVTLKSLTRCHCFCFPGALTQAIRNFAKSLEGWLNNAMNAIPQRMIQTKVHFQYSYYLNTTDKFIKVWMVTVCNTWLFVCALFRLPLLVPLRKHCADTHLWTTWLRRHVLFCKTRHRSTRCWVILIVLTLPMYRSEQLFMFSYFPSFPSL